MKFFGGVRHDSRSREPTVILDLVAIGGFGEFCTIQSYLQFYEIMRELRHRCVQQVAAPHFRRRFKSSDRLSSG